MTNSPGLNLSPDDARIGAGLLSLLFRADWVRQRTYELEFLDGNALSWTAKVDLIVPEGAPFTEAGNDFVRLIPLGRIAKGRIADIAAREEHATPWIPAHDEVERWLKSAIAKYAGFENAEQAQADAPLDLRYHRALTDEVEQNTVLIAGVPGPAGARRILEYTWEDLFRLPPLRFRLLLSSLGFSPWKVATFIGGSGGSQQIRIAVPQGADLLKVTASALGEPHHHQSPIVFPGGTPRVSFVLPDGNARYTMTIFVRISRRGWLTNAWMISVITCAFTLLGRVNLSAYFAQQATTSATVLAALIGVFVTLMVASPAHPFVSRLMTGLRLISGLDFAIIAVAAGNLLTRHAGPLPTPLWTILTALAGAMTALLSISLILPRKLPRSQT